MWSVFGRYVASREGDVVGKWSVKVCEWSVELFVSGHIYSMR